MGSATGESRWEKPGNDESNASSAGQNGDWERCADENGQQYWYNHRTQVSSWEIPNPISDCWEQHASDNGEPYWYNHHTGESSWEMPSLTNPIYAGGALE